MTLDDESKFTINVLGQDNRPITGLRVTPDMLRRTVAGKSVWATIPASWHERLTATTNGTGVATLTYLPGIMKPVSVRVAGQGVAPHTLRLESPEGSNAVLKLGRPGRVVGIVRATSGAPLAGIPVQVWVQGPKILRSDFSAGDPFGNRRITPDEILPFDQSPLKTGPQGAFQTPATLLSGSTYRVIIRHEGFEPFVSDWVTLSGDRAAIPPIRLQPFQKLAGRITDRQGRALAGVRVFIPAGGPSALTDAQGGFTLAGITPGKAVILVEQKGFRLYGQLVDPSSTADVGVLTLVRLSESITVNLKPLADPISHDESRALANRLLDPYLRITRENGVSAPRPAAIAALSEIDLSRALELLRAGEFRDEDRIDQLVRKSLAAKLAVKEPAQAEAMADSVVDPATRVSALAGVVKALPTSERIRKRAILERATAMLKNGAQSASDVSHLQQVSSLAEGWLDLGERDRARLLLEEVKMSNAVFQTEFLSQLARLEPDGIVERLRKLPTPQANAGTRDHALAQVACQLAIDHPALAEQVFNLRDARNNQTNSLFDLLRFCRHLAGVDPQRALRAVDSARDPATRASGFAHVALGLAEKDTIGARDAIDRAIQEIDRLRNLAPSPEPSTGGVFHLHATNPAAVILPVVERVAPNRLAEVYWRAVALHSRVDTEHEDLLKRSNASFECILLARYDRDVAAGLFEPFDSYIRGLATETGLRDELDPSFITAKACIDPRAAVVLVESVSTPRNARRGDPTELARIRLAQVLGMPPEQRWLWLWHATAIRLDD